MNFIEAFFFGGGLMSIRGYLENKVMFIPYSYTTDPDEESDISVLAGLLASIVMVCFGIDYFLYAIFDWSFLHYSNT